MPFTLQKLKDSLPLQQMATTDRQILLFCIALAFVFWLILNLSQDYELNKDVNIDYLVSPERVIDGDPPRTVSVQLRGRGWNLIWESLRGRAINVAVDVENNPSLLLSTNLLQQKISRELSSGDLEVDNLGYEAQRVVTTEREGKLVPVIPRVTMKFAPGYFAAAGMVLVPDSVRVSGTPEVLENVVDWPTDPIALKKLEEDTEITVALQAPPRRTDPQLRGRPRGDWGGGLHRTAIRGSDTPAERPTIGFIPSLSRYGNCYRHYPGK